MVSDIHLDFETRSDVDLKEVGLYNYVTHPSTRVLLAAWTDPLTGEVKQRTYEDGFGDLLADVGDVFVTDYADNLGAEMTRICAWNAAFEWAVMRFVLGWTHIRLDRMYCVMAHALYRAFPAKLDKAAQVMLDRGKLDGAERLLRVWCFPTPPSGTRPKVKPGDWDRLCAYNRIDVELERDIAHFLRDCGLPWPEAEQRVWLKSEFINWRGVKIDVDACRAAVAMHNRITEKALAEIKAITGVKNPNSGAQLCEWLDVPSLAKDVVPTYLLTATGDRKRVLELRQQIALSAPKKYSVALAHANGGRVRNMLQYSGAGRTHRWSGRGIQPQNLRRGLKSDEQIAQYWEVILRGDDAALARMGDPFVILANLVRTIIVPANGRRLNVADYSSIEVVMAHWGAGDEPMLVKLREGLDPYKVFAASHWRIPMADVSKEQRTFSKPVVLGCAYGLGANTLVDYAEGMGVAMTLEEATAAVATYRESNKAIVRFWYGLEEAMRKAIAKPGATFKFRHFAFRFVDNGDDRHYCLMRLPSGTSITYWNAGIDPDTDKLFYWGVDQYTGNWARIKTWGGKLVENAVQSISRDVLVYGMTDALTLRLDIVLHVHDEMVNDETREDDERTLVDCMSPPDWCPDAPIHAAAFSCPRYRKD